MRPDLTMTTTRPQSATAASQTAAPWRPAVDIMSIPHLCAWSKDADLRYTDVTPTWELYTGISRDLAIGRRDVDFRPAEIAELFAEQDRSVLSSGSSETYESHYDSALGVRAFATTKFPLRDSEGRIVGIGGVSSERQLDTPQSAVNWANTILLGSVLDSMPDPIVRFNQKMQVTFANPAFLATFALGPREVTGRFLADLVGRPIGELFAEAAATITMTTPETRFEKPILIGPGQTRWREWRIAGVFSDGGTLVEVQAVGRDITADRRYRTTLERLVAAGYASPASLPDTVSEVLSIGLDYLDMDLAAVVGSGRTSVVLDHLQLRSRAEPSSGHQATVRDAIDVTAEFGAKSVMIADLGEATAGLRALRTRYGLGSLAIHQVETSGTVYGRVVFAGYRRRRRDWQPQELMLVSLLAQWLAFAADRYAQIRALSLSRAELSLVFDNVPAHIAYKNALGETLSANAAARAQVRPAESAARDEAVLRAHRPALAEIECWEGPDGEVTWMRVDRIPFLAPSTEDPQVLVVATDVTDLVAKEQALAKANEGLNQFAYVASHDLQEPLRKIGTFTDLLMDGLQNDNRTDVDYAVRVIKDSSRRASTLISDLLSWSRLTNRALDRKPLAFDVVVRETLNDLVLARPDLALEVVDAMEPTVVNADAIHVRQLVENLLVNAIKYRDPGRALRLTLGLRKGSRRSAVFEVSDNGIGFDQSYAHLIFEPFRRLHSEKKYSGTGVGLAICSRVCERHGWTIAAEGRPGEGATFRVEMPNVAARL